MKIFSALKRLVRRKSVVAGAFGGILLASVGLWFASSANGVSITPVTGGCNSSAVIYCGAVQNGTSTTETFLSRYNSNASAQNIFTGFFSGTGVTNADIQAIGSTAVAGAVNKNGDVVVGNQVVATGAITAGRVSMANSTRKEYNKTVYYERAPSVSLDAASNPAFVVMKNNKFLFAVIGSCANPVKATPKTPSYTVKKEVQKKGDTAWSKSVVDLLPGSKVTFRVTYANNGPINIKNVAQHDFLPVNLKYVEGTFKSSVAALSDPGRFFSNDGITIATFATGTSVQYTFDAVVAPNDNVMTCKAETFVNAAYQAAPGMAIQSDTASVAKKCAPKPVYVCNSLAVTNAGDRTKFRFTPNVTIKDATLKSAVYTVKNSSGSTVDTISRTNLNPVDYTQEKDGKYSVNLVVTVTIAGKDYIASGTCAANFEVVPKPVYVCESLKVLPGGTRTQFIFVPKATIAGGATLKSAVYTVKNSSGSTVDTISRTNLNQVEYNQEKEGTYKVSLVINVTVGGYDKVATGTCEASFTVTPPPATPVYECTSFTPALVEGQKNTYRFTLAYKADGGAVLSNVAIDWGDGTVESSVPLNQLNSLQHAFTKSSTQKVTLSFTINGDTANVKTATCSSSITFAPDMCTIPGKEQYPADDVNCKQPEVLVNTGPGDIAGIFAATTVAGMIAYRFVLARRQ